MRIALFVSYLPPHVGGIEAVADGQIKSLAALGHEVTVMTSACGATAGLERHDSYSIRRVSAWNYLEQRLGAAFPIIAPSAIWHGYHVARRADVIHAHDAFYLTSLVAAVWAWVLRKPLILTQHVDLIPHPRRIVQLGQRIVYSTTGRFILRTSQRVIVLNNRVWRFVVERGVAESAIVFLPNGVDTVEFAPLAPDQKRELRQRRKVPNDTLLALFVGRFVPKKGLAKLLMAEPISGLEVVLVGGDPPTGMVRSDHHFLGAISRQDMSAIYQMCDIFVLPSEGEGFPVTVQEAMSTGLSIIVGADEAYAPYDLDESLVRFIKTTTDDIASALRELSEDSELLLNMAAYSRRYAVTSFSWSRHAKQLQALYERATKPVTTRQRHTPSRSAAVANGIDSSGRRWPDPVAGPRVRPDGGEELDERPVSAR